MHNTLFERDMSMIRSDSSIDFKNPLALLVTNFSSIHEVGEDQSKTTVLSFETKPKSGVTEYIPSITHKFIEDNRDSLTKFFEAEDGKL